MRKLNTGGSRGEQIEAFASDSDPALGSSQKKAKPLSAPAGADKDSPQQSRPEPIRKKATGSVEQANRPEPVKRVASCPD
ncbi:MAG: hypothetical protein CR977_02440 [Gammaproteobacteria bacterium]|nr:MAG: hypothetical protein CR977_02440 [Gammaproteobacteria bacterium]